MVTKMSRSRRATYPKRLFPFMLKRQWRTEELSKSTPRVDILLLISTFLFGVTVQILDKYSLSSDIKGLFLESSVLLLFGAYLFLLASWGQSIKWEVARDYEQIAIVQLLVLNGLLVSLLVSYAISLIGVRSDLFGENEEGVYVLVLVFLFVILPVIAYSRNPIITFGTVFGFTPADLDLDVPILLGAMPMTFFFMLMFTVLLAYSSKVLNIIVMASLFLYLPYIGIRTKYSIKRFVKTHRYSTLWRYLVYSLGIYRAYFVVMIVSLFYDYLKITDQFIVIIALLALLTYVVALFAERTLLASGIGIALLGACLLVVIYALFIKNISMLFGAIFIIYMLFIVAPIFFALLMYGIDKVIKVKLQM